MIVTGKENISVGMRLPDNFGEQKDYLPGFATRVQIAAGLFEHIGTLLTVNGIVFDLAKSTYRAKDDGRIKEKLERKGGDQPIYDLYGLRIITDHPDRQAISKLIQSVYPNTPPFFKGGRPSVIDFSDAKSSEYFRKNFNPSITEKYRSLHVNVVFALPHIPIFSIAQIQIRDLEEYNRLGPTSALYREYQKKLRLNSF